MNFHSVRATNTHEVIILGIESIDAQSEIEFLKEIKKSTEFVKHLHNNRQHKTLQSKVSKLIS